MSKIIQSPPKGGTTKHEQPALMKEFSAARQHVENIREAGRRASHESILLGHELNRLKLELKVGRGGDRKSNPQSAGLIGWEELLEQQTGLSADTCNRCMQLAQGAKKHIPILTAGDVLKTPFNALPEARQAEVSKALEKAADGRSMTQMMFDFGVWKEKKLNHPPKPTKASAAKRNANKNDETLQAAELMALTEEHIETLEQITLAAAFKAADDERLHVACEASLKLCSAQTEELITRKSSTSLLASMENAVDALKQAIADELKQRRKAK
jgi:hypothetical protein